MAASKRPSTSSLRRFITSRPYVTVAELRRRFGLDDPDAMSCLAHEGRQVYVGLPEREALKIDDLLGRGEIGVELSVEVRAPVAVGVYPMRIARYVVDGPVNGNGGHVPEVQPAMEALDDVAVDEPMPAAEIPASPAIVLERPSTGEHHEAGRPPEADAADPINGNGHPPLPRPRDARSTRHNGRPAPHRHRRGRHHRPNADPGAAPGHSSAGPQ